MLASRLPGILPPLNDDEALEVAAVQSVLGTASTKQSWRQRPFRSPHHTASAPALVGGGSYPRPGEISLAHKGVLFLDELPEFQRRVLEVLREPLESGEIMIARASQQVRYPADFQLIAAMNPCPCGYHGSQQQACRCSPDQLRRYRDKISGPLLDRIDLHVPVSPLPASELTQAPTGEPTSTVRKRVLAARQRQQSRAGKPNALLNQQELERDCKLDQAELDYLEFTLQRLKLSARAYHRILKVARTVADLEPAPSIARKHLAEAISMRGLDRSPS